MFIYAARATFAHSFIYAFELVSSHACVLHLALVTLGAWECVLLHLRFCCTILWSECMAFCCRNRHFSGHNTVRSFTINPFNRSAMGSLQIFFLFIRFKKLRTTLYKFSTPSVGSVFHAIYKKKYPAISEQANQRTKKIKCKSKSSCSGKSTADAFIF